MAKHKITVLWTEQQIQKRVQEIAASLDKRFLSPAAPAALTAAPPEGQAAKPRSAPLMVVGVLKGAFVFCADLVRALKQEVQCDFCAAQSYGLRDKPSQTIQLKMDIEANIAGRDVLLVEDILDRGLTLAFLQQHLKSKNPRSLTTAVLIAKPFKPPPLIDYIGFKANPSDFIVGYGLDYKEQYRRLPYLAHLKR